MLRPGWGKSETLERAAVEFGYLAEPGAQPQSWGVT
jgi:hypothetical protein